MPHKREGADHENVIGSSDSRYTVAGRFYGFLSSAFGAAGFSAGLLVGLPQPMVPQAKQIKHASAISFFTRTFLSMRTQPR
jgi:hypothetical protein